MLIILQFSYFKRTLGKLKTNTDAETKFYLFLFECSWMLIERSECKTRIGELNYRNRLALGNLVGNLIKTCFFLTAEVFLAYRLQVPSC